MGTAFGVCFTYWWGTSALMWFLSYVCNAHITSIQLLSMLVGTLSKIRINILILLYKFPCTCLLSKAVEASDKQKFLFPVFLLIMKKMYVILVQKFCSVLSIGQYWSFVNFLGLRTHWSLCGYSVGDVDSHVTWPSLFLPVMGCIWWTVHIKNGKSIPRARYPSSCAPVVNFTNV